MELETIINIIFGSATVVAVITAYSQRYKVRAEAAAIAATAAEKAVASALQAQTVVVEHLQYRNENLSKLLIKQDLVVEKLQQRARDAEERLYAVEQEQEREQQTRVRLLATFSIAIRYINALRLQVEAIGNTPLPWPAALEDWLTAYAPPDADRE